MSKEGKSKTCSVIDCDNQVKCKGLCSKHYQRMKSHGDVNAVNSKRAYGCLVPGCNGNHRSKGYCEKHYTRFIRHGDVNHTTIITGDDRKRILSAVSISESGCWVWGRYIHRGGYGVTSLNGVAEQAHRASWMVFVGEIPVGVQVNHKCHNRACINPDHLYLGNQVENMRDMAEAGRENRASGERNGSSKLTKEIVLEIRSLIRDRLKNKDIAILFGIAQTTVSAIRTGKIWAWLK